jgi:serine/threonine-protein kinase
MSHCPRDGAVLEEATSDPLVGRTFAARYVIEAVIGEGGMGRVYLARHARMRRRFAIKVLHSELSTHDTMVVRFQREAAAISRLSHRNVVAIVDFGETDGGLLYLVMEYVAGMSLRQLLNRDGAMASDRALRLLDQLCDGLAHAHRHGLVHRDFKPDNVLIEDTDDGEQARIVDFGIAADVGEQRITTDGVVLGTPHYMAPEQTLGTTLDQRSDLYALGVVLYEMVAGVLPFSGPPALVAQMHALTPAPPMADRAPGVAVDPLLEALALRLMAKRPEQRPSSAHDVRRLVQLGRTDRARALIALGVAPSPDSEQQTQPALRAPLLEPPQPAERALAVAVLPREHRWRSTPPRPVGVVWPWLVATAAVIGMALATVHVLRPEPGAVTAAAALAVSVPPKTAAANDVRIVELLTEPVAPSPAATPPAIPTAADAAAMPAPVAIASAGGPATIAAAPSRRPPRSLTQRYRTLGKRLNRLIARRGAAATSQLRARYLAIPIADALRDPALAPRVSREVAALRRTVDRELR